MTSFMPVEMVFAPNWWLRHYGISFDTPFYFDPAMRMANDLLMGKAVYDRFGLGDGGGNPRPVIGSMHVAGGFIVPALLGVETRFSSNQAPWPVPRNLSKEEVLDLRV